MQSSGGMRTMTDRGFVLDSEFGMTFSSMMASSRGTMTMNSKAFEKSGDYQMDRYKGSNIPLPLNRVDQFPASSIAQIRGPNKPPPIKVPPYVPMDMVAEVRDSQDASISQSKLSPSLLPDWARRNSQRSTSTSVKRQTVESGRVV